MWRRCAAASLGGPTARPERPPPSLNRTLEDRGAGPPRDRRRRPRHRAAPRRRAQIERRVRRGQIHPRRLPSESPILHDTTTLTEPPTRQRGTSGNGPLTHRELTILTLLASALSEADIGRNLFVSHSTVHSHVKSIYRKLGVCSRAAALKTAHAAGFR